MKETKIVPLPSKADIIGVFIHQLGIIFHQYWYYRQFNY